MQSLAYVAASNGAANPSLMTVQNVRAPGATSIITNTVAGAPAFFYGTMGTPHTFTDPVTSEVITVISEASAVDFAGTLNSGHVDIVAIAPGYTDLGSKVGDIVIIRPITEWANNIFNILSQSHNDNGSIKNSAITYNANISNYVASGGILAGLGYGSTLTASLSSGSCYINGNLQIIAAVATRTYTASKDTYVDALYNANGTATIVYTEVANNAASPALAANSIRLGIVVSAANIAAATSISQGAFTNTVPVISSQILRGNDTLGNVIYPKGVVASTLITDSVKFSVYRAAAASTTGGVYTKVGFDTKVFDTGNNFDAVTNNRFVAPVAGYYWFHGSAYFNVAATQIYKVGLFKNGALLREGDVGFSTSAGVGSYAPAVSGLFQLAAGDYIELFSYANTTTEPLIVGPTATYFDGELRSTS